MYFIATTEVASASFIPRINDFFTGAHHFEEPVFNINKLTLNQL